MVMKIYALLWLVMVASVGAVRLTGNSNDLTQTVFGFTFATLAFMGIVAVLPWWVDKQYSWRY